MALYQPLFSLKIAQPSSILRGGAVEQPERKDNAKRHAMENLIFMELKNQNNNDLSIEYPNRALI